MRKQIPRYGALVLLVFAAVAGASRLPEMRAQGGGTLDPPNGGQVSVYVKDADTDSAGNFQILYDASNGHPEGDVSNRVLQVDPFGKDPNGINDAIILDAITQTRSPASSHVVVFGGAVRHYEGPQ